MAEFVVSQTGINLNDLVPQVIEAVLKAAAEAGRVEGENIMSASKEIVPFDQGVLRASADAVGVNVDQGANGIEVVFGYGGAASSYSVIQHETPPGVFSHAPGKSWKYLEAPAMAAAEGMEGRLGEAISKKMEGKFRGSA